MRRSTFLLAGALLAVSTYAAGLTLGVGTKRVMEKFDEKIVLPVMDAVFRPDEPPTNVILQRYTEVQCPNTDYIAIAYFGQSNATNTVEPMAENKFPENLIQYDWKGRKCYAFQEPLLGADFEKGNNITYAAIEIAEATEKPVVIAPFGFGPSSILEWAYGGGSTQLRLALESLRASGISPQVFLWHQGESDVPNDNVDETVMAKVPYFKRPVSPLKTGEHRWGITGEPYKEALERIVRQTQAYFPDSYFGIALVGIAPCLGRNEPWQPLRDAQTAVANSMERTFISADSDALAGPSNRYDTCHFSRDGAKRLSAEYVKSISKLGVLPEGIVLAGSGSR